MENNFYVLREKHGNYAKAISNETDEFFKHIKKCPMCGAIAERPNVKHRMYFVGKKEGDYYFTTSCHVASSKLVQVLYNHEVSGFEAKKIECTGWYDGKGNLLDKDASGYKELVITGRAGYLQTRRGAEVPRCQKCGCFLGGLKSTKELLREGGFEVNDEWDGGDMFHYKNWKGAIIVTERVKQLLEDNKIKNVILTKLDEFKMVM